MATRTPLAAVDINCLPTETETEHGVDKASESGKAGVSTAGQVLTRPGMNGSDLHSQGSQVREGKTSHIEEDTPRPQPISSSADMPPSANASTTPNAPPPVQQMTSESVRLAGHATSHAQSGVSEGTRSPGATASKRAHQPFPTISEKRSASDQYLAQRAARSTVEGTGTVTAKSEETVQFDIATLKQAFTAQYHTLAAKCQGWERYAAKLKAQLEALEIDHSLMKETCAQQTMEAQRLEARVDSQTKYIERLEAENGDLREMYRERENRSREVESRLSSLEERLAARAPSSAASTAASHRRPPTASASRMASHHMEQHVQSVLKNVYQPPSPPSSVTDSSHSRTHTVGPPQDGRAAFHSSNIRYSSDEERMQRDFRAPSPLDFGNLDHILSQPVSYHPAPATVLPQPVGRPASRATSRQGQRYGSGSMATRDEPLPPPREGGRESRLGHRRPDEPIKQYVGASAGDARFVDENGSIHAGEGENSELVKAWHGNGVQSYLRNDDQPIARPHSRVNHVREGAPSPPSLDARTDDRPRGIDRANKQALEGSTIANAYPSHFVRSTSALGLAAPQYPFVRSGSAASIQTVTSSNGMTGTWPHVRSSTDPMLATMPGQQVVNVTRPLRRSSFHQQQQLAQLQSRRNSVSTSRLSNYSSDGTGQLPVKRGGSKMPSSRNGSVGVHDAIPIVKDDVFSDGKQNILPAASGRKSSIGSVAKARLASSRPSGAPGQGQSEQGEQCLVPQQGHAPPDGRTSALANHYNERHVPAQMRRERDTGEADLAPSSHFSPPSSSGREEQASASSSTQYATSLPLSHSTNESIVHDVSCGTTSGPGPAADEMSAIAAAEARRGAHRRLYLCLREELSPEDLQKFERYVHRYDALEIPVDGPRGLVNRVKKLLLLSDSTLRERPEEWKRRKELAREFERVVSADT